MRSARGSGSRARSSLAWLGSALIVGGGALNLMAIAVLGATDRGPTQPPMSEIRFTAADSVGAPRMSSLGASSRPDLLTAGRSETARVTPSHETASLRLAAGKLTAGEGSGMVTRNDREEASTDDDDTGVYPSPPQTAVHAAEMPPATHITISAVGVDADIVEVTSTKTEIGGRTVFTWEVADWAAGHHDLSANPGEGGNIVLSGHDDVRGEVFRGLHDITLGDQVSLASASGIRHYVVTEIHVREYRDAPLEEQIAAGQFLMPMPEERLTLVTCWPYGIDTHRIIVVAKPLVAEEGWRVNGGPTAGD